MTNNNAPSDGPAFLEQLGDRLDDICRKINEYTFSDCDRLFSAVKLEFLRRAEPNWALCIAISKAVAERTFFVAVSKGCDYPLCKDHFDSLNQWGFEDIFERAVFTVIFARYCFSIEVNAEAHGLLESLMADLEFHQSNCGEQIALVKSLINQDDKTN